MSWPTTKGRGYVAAEKARRRTARDRKRAKPTMREACEAVATIADRIEAKIPEYNYEMNPSAVGKIERTCRSHE